MKRIIAAAALLAASALPALASNKEDLATKILAVGAFVDKNCVGYETDGMMMRAAMAKLGVDVEKLVKNQARMTQGELIIRAFETDVRTSCREAVKLFGPNGNTIPGLLKAD